MNTREIEKIYVGSTQGEKLYLGDELVWPVSGPGPDTGDTGSTSVRLAITYRVTSTEYHTTISVNSNLPCFSKAELADGTEINIKSHYYTGKYLFSETGLQTVYYTLTGTSIDTARAFYNCTSITDVTIPEGVTEIGTEIFHNCSSITSVTFSNTVTIIGSQSFRGNTSLPTVTIPSSVTSFSKFAFLEASAMTEMIFTGVTPPTFTPTDGNPVIGIGTYPIYVPDASVSAYIAAVNASGFNDQAYRIHPISDRT